jgi:transcriptional repressor NrdR
VFWGPIPAVRGGTRFCGRPSLCLCVLVYSEIRAQMPQGAIVKCPVCQCDNDRVIDTRASQDGSVIRRRRQCLACTRRYTTYERIERTSVTVIKKDGVREPFDHSKIKRGLEKACWKRPISDTQLEGIIAAVENELEANFESEVESRQVGELVMKHLRRLDQVAFVRFASVYRQFEDVHDFVSELKPMLDECRRSTT